MDSALNTPWKVRNEFWRFITYPYLRFVFGINRIAWGVNWRIYGIPIIQKHRQSTMYFGAGFSLRSSVFSNPLGPYRPVILCTWREDAILEIGDNFGMTGGTICAAKKITVGKNVIIGANCTIIDTDFHPLDAEVRKRSPQEGQTAPINIEDEVFIGMNCIILKGVTIGQSSVIGAGSVVTRNIPPHVIAAGNPIKVIRDSIT